LRAEAARTADAKQARRILAIAMVLDGHSRLLAAHDDLLGWRHEGAPHDVQAGLLIVVDKLASDGMASKRAMPPAEQDALFNGRPVCVERTFRRDPSFPSARPWSRRQRG